LRFFFVTSFWLRVVISMYWSYAGR